MKKQILPVLLFAVFFTALMPGFTAFARDKDDITASMRSRHPGLLEAKNNGYVGEAWNGLVGLVDSGTPQDVQELVSAENNDRKALFGIIARETGTSVAEVARQNRIRMYRLAGGEHFLQDPERRWIKKKNLAP